ncbi:MULTISPECIES: ABC transporter permease [Paenibacillus]|uniref:ABC transporter permease n=1 Tax=Paenibacillus TaxID=44249 RepID=UPI00096CFFF8|nr:ABC transporter permease [Paenibacillus odorifer]OMC70053.1 peptide ABC transporter permease [Paenibacillus odorifer]OMC80749.1 peptide ABC transporter permease [Paenibacillus odorifer]OMD99909.1 peptide ABC transporter permease [Paenibacillus odorifer]OME05423.1 peptide ABC transporter permease [Paenibacillus odorifer]
MDAIENMNLQTVKVHMKKQHRSLMMRRLLANKSMVFGSIIVLILVIAAIAAPYITKYDPYEMTVADRLKAPDTNHWFGTDNFGRDIFSRTLYGAQVSMGVGFAVALATSAMGLVIGLYASYYRFLDNILMRICDGLMAFPGILLSIALMAALGANVTNVIIALSIVFTPAVARAVRSSAIVVREQTYIEAMKAQGASGSRILWMHIAPNTLSPLIVQSTFIFAEAIIVEASLSFLGTGIPAPSPSWGNILYDGKLVIMKAWWMTVFPGLTMVLSVLSLNLFGDGLRDLLDPHTQNVKK